MRIQEEVVGRGWGVPQTIWSSTPAGSVSDNERSVPLSGTGPRSLLRPSTGRKNARMTFPPVNCSRWAGGFRSYLPTFLVAALLSRLFARFRHCLTVGRCSATTIHTHGDTLATGTIPARADARSAHCAGKAVRLRASCIQSAPFVLGGESGERGRCVSEMSWTCQSGTRKIGETLDGGQARTTGSPSVSLPLGACRLRRTGS